MGFIADFKPKLTKAMEEMNVWPDFINERVKLYDRLMEKYRAGLAEKVRGYKESLDDYTYVVCLAKSRHQSHAA